MIPDPIVTAFAAVERIRALLRLSEITKTWNNA